MDAEILQNLAAGVCVLLAAAFLLRRAWRFFKGQSGGCGPSACGGCGSGKTEESSNGVGGFVSLEAVSGAGEEATER